jgi:hypothetical protein
VGRIWQKISEADYSIHHAVRQQQGNPLPPDHRTKVITCSTAAEEPENYAVLAQLRLRLRDKRFCTYGDPVSTPSRQLSRSCSGALSCICATPGLASNDKGREIPSVKDCPRRTTFFKLMSGTLSWVVELAPNLSSHLVINTRLHAIFHSFRSTKIFSGQTLQR